ncbi:hypothetical protein [Roseomonas gilardii]|uniref:hypothetical protein n=1 Tax=Roseomonas gilardii TaxID=257708 RepID=UPI0004816ECE|nr:hypothetical protein [Roseomonas gilardii]
MSRRTLIFAAGLATGAAALVGSGRATVPSRPVAAPADAAATLAAFCPAGYREVWRRPVTVDGEAATLLRHVREDGRNAGPGGEHFSAVLDGADRLKGLARMELALAGGVLPSRDEARIIARTFLREAAPDLLPGLRESWIEPHDEPLRVTRDGRTEAVTLTGMKVKMRDTASGRWFWVIVGADRRVMVFERDIVWISFPGRRQTEKWLHDTWLAERGFDGRGA